MERGQACVATGAEHDRPVLEVEGLTVELGGRRVVDGVDFRLGRGERRGVIGESGSGKSLTGLALLGLLPTGARAGGSVRFDGEELLGLPESRRAQFRGASIAMVFQDALSALNPLVRVGRQVAEPLRRHRGLARSEAHAAAIEMLARVGFSDPERAVRCCPPQLSGGQRQRVALAMALACRPAVLVADEPTTALDVTVQADILALLTDIADGDDAPALLFISHDLAVVAQLCSSAMVMHNGTIVEHAPMTDLIRAPQHPQTVELVESALSLEAPPRHHERKAVS
ncbi:ABC transporter ATP-binding protein [Saccharopolyspora erythraea]|nr:ABC transporter ATP-binding protein [Saccharopolyspora erythraea]QRK92295.1 ABC transporter ATP-binding protein [Saccharopolyspora erythraea]